MCEADLRIKVLPRGAAVLGVPSAKLRVQLIVKNRGEDAYGVALQVHHLPGFSFRRAQASQVCGTPKYGVGRDAGVWAPQIPALYLPQASTLVPIPIHCWDSQGIKGQLWGLTCNLSCPVLRSGWQVRAGGQRWGAGVAVGQPLETPQLCPMSGGGGGDL